MPKRTFWDFFLLNNWPLNLRLICPTSFLYIYLYFGINHNENKKGGEPTKKEEHPERQKSSAITVFMKLYVVKFSG